MSRCVVADEERCCVLKEEQAPRGRATDSREAPRRDALCQTPATGDGTAAWPTPTPCTACVERFAVEVGAWNRPATRNFPRPRFWSTVGLLYFAWWCWYMLLCRCLADGGLGVRCRHSVF